MDNQTQNKMEKDIEIESISGLCRACNIGKLTNTTKLQCSNIPQHPF